MCIRDSVDTAVIEDAFKHEPALTLNLLRVVNSVGCRGSRLAQPVTTLRHAITLFGRRQLQRWLSLLLLAPGSDGGDPARSPLLQVAALRGRMMELLIEHGPSGDHRKLADLAFITGILSMMPVALGLPIGSPLAGMPGPLLQLGTHFIALVAGLACGVMVSGSVQTTRSVPPEKAPPFM